MQGQDIESWIYRNIDDREAIVSFRGTMTPGHMLTDIDLDLAAFNPGGRRESRSPEDVSDEIPDEEIMKGPLEPLMNMCKVKLCTHLVQNVAAAVQQGMKWGWPAIVVFDKTTNEQLGWLESGRSSKLLSQSKSFGLFGRCPCVCSDIL